jgi:hypothetical protein
LAPVYDVIDALDYDVLLLLLYDYVVATAALALTGWVGGK